MNRLQVIVFCLTLGFVVGYLSGEANAYTDISKSFLEHKQ